jgi:hypothetical protein
MRSKGNFSETTIFESPTDAQSGWEDEMDISDRFADAKCQVIGGRTGIVLGIVVFISTYIYGVLHFGWMAGIAIGWLPSGLLAWAIALAGERVVTSALQKPTILQPLSSSKRD